MTGDTKPDRLTNMLADWTKPVGLATDIRRFAHAAVAVAVTISLLIPPAAWTWVRDRMRSDNDRRH